MKRIKRFLKLVLKKLTYFTFSSHNYWEKRYARGGNSGAGSYNQIAEFKTKVINDFITLKKVDKILDYGCGDGNQCKYFLIKNYLGIDVSKTSIKICKEKYNNDNTKKFLLWNKQNESLIYEFKPDLVISLDVIFHLVEDVVFEQYLNNLFSFSQKYVIIFSTNRNEQIALHQKNRKFTDYIEEKISNWELNKIIENPYKGADSQADFYIYEKVIIK